MPENISDRTIFSLSEVTRSIQKTLSDRYTSTFWVRAEMNRLNLYPQSGHCYPDLVEKADGRIIAEMRSTIWKDDFDRINTRFLSVLREPLKNGISILFCARVAYSPVHGLSLWIQDIDPSYTLGELEREKRETIERLRKEGVFDANRMLPMPLLPKRIAVVSVQTSKGYADFLQVIEGNSWGYRIFHMLFPSLLQGENAVPSIIGQLRRIRRVIRHFDAVAVIRGGGGDIGLASYNNYDLAREIALFPIPVLTGIGHSTNETVSEMVSHRNAITPTELADFLLQQFHNFSVPLQRARETVATMSRARLKEERVRLMNTGSFLKKDTVYLLSHSAWLVGLAPPRMRNALQRSLSLLQGNLDHAKNGLANASGILLREKIRALSALEKQVELTDPARVLGRGYSLTLVNGKVLTSAGAVSPGDELTTLLADGEITSTVNSSRKIKQP